MADDQFDYPAETSVKDMTADQQAEYWREKAQKHEKQWKSYQDKTDDELRQEVARLRGASNNTGALLRKLGVTDDASADALIAKRDRAEALANDLATDTERAAREARENTEKELRPQLQAQAVEDAFRLLIGDSKTDTETTDFLADLNLNRFIGENGRVDTAKVRARAEQFAPAKGTSTTSNKGPTVTGHGSAGGKPTGSLSGATSGADLYDRLHPKKTA